MIFSIRHFVLIFMLCCFSSVSFAQFGQTTLPFEGTSALPADESIVNRLNQMDDTLRLLARQLEGIDLRHTALNTNENITEDLQRLLQEVTIQLQLLNEQKSDGADTHKNINHSDVARLSVQLDQIEEIMRGLRGQVDTVSFRLAQLVTRFEKVTADTEFRFQELNATMRQNETRHQNSIKDQQILGVLPLGANDEIQRITTKIDDMTTLIGEEVLDDKDSVTMRFLGQPEEMIQQEMPENPKKLYDNALGNLRVGRYERAQAEFMQFLKFFPDDTYAGHAQYWLGEVYYVRRMYKEAMKTFLTGYTKYPDNIKASASLLKLGMSLIITGEKKMGCDAFSELSSRFPQASSSIKKRVSIESKRAGCL